MSTPASLGGFKNISLLIGWPCRNADFISDLIFHLCEIMIAKTNVKFSLKSAGDSVLILSLSIYSKPRATKRPL